MHVYTHLYTDNVDIFIYTHIHTHTFLYMYCIDIFIYRHIIIALVENNAN